MQAISPTGELVKNAGALSWSDVDSGEAALIERCANGDQSACAELAEVSEVLAKLRRLDARDFGQCLARHRADIVRLKALEAPQINR